MLSNPLLRRLPIVVLRFTISLVWLTFMLICVYGGLFIFLFGRP